MKLLFKCLLCLALIVIIFTDMPYKWTMWVLAGACCYAIILCNGGFGFWKACAKDPCFAYNFMKEHPNEFQVITKYDDFDQSTVAKANGWSGPYSLVVPALGMVKIYIKHEESKSLELELIRKIKENDL